MKFLRITLQLLFLAVLAVGPAFGATCTNATLSGVFGVLNTGFDAPGQPGTSVGQYLFDGKGNVSGAFTDSANGTISNQTFTGTYAVSKNCTGTLTLTDSGGVTEHHSFVIDDSKKGLQLIRADSPQIRSGFALAQGVVTCGLTGKKQTFAFDTTGYDDKGRPIALVGQAVLDGKGGLSGSTTLSIDGTIGTSSISGTYTESADCTGTQQFTIQAVNSTSNLNFVVVSAGKEILMIGTDTGSTTSGTAQQ
jgi:hypothetical protein